MQLRKKLDQRGMGLIEVIAALGISVVVITSLVSLSVFTIRSSLTSNLLLEGTRIANTELELVRAYRDQPALSWFQFLTNISSCDTGPCNISTSGGLSVGSGSKTHKGSDDTLGTADDLVISFRANNTSGGNIAPDTDTAVRISVEVKWMIGGNAKYARLYTDLTNWADK